MSFADRHRLLTGYVGGRDDPADPAQVLAMPIVLHIEKTAPPARGAVLTAAARAAVLLCLDERADPRPEPRLRDAGRDDQDPEGPGPWYAAVAGWCDARIRKISRRARGAQWTAAQEVWGLTVDCGGAQARAIVPGPVGELDRRIARLQIGGTDVEGELTPSSDEAEVSLWINPTLDMTVGKLAAQVGHGSMLAAGLFGVDEAQEWWREGCPLRVAIATEPQWTELVGVSIAPPIGPASAVAVRDAGFTEVVPGSMTVIAHRRRSADHD